MGFIKDLIEFGKSLTPGIVGAAGGYLQSRADAQSAKYNTDQTIAANQRLAEYQYSKDLEMWNKGNEYNSPSAQMARLKEAGLNPNFMYGSSGATQPAVALPKYQAPRVDFNYKPAVNIPAMLSMYQDFQVKNAQLDNLREDRKLKEVQNKAANTFVSVNEHGEVVPGGIQGLNITAMPAWRAKSHGDALRRWYEGQRAGTINQYQGDVSRQNLNKLESEISLIEDRRRLLDAQIEWFMGDKLASYLGVGGGLLKNLGGMFRSGSKASKGLAPASDWFKNYKPSVNPRNQWRGKYIDNYGYDN